MRAAVRWVLVVACLLTVGAVVMPAGPPVAAAAATVPGAEGGYVPLWPSRALDTRNGTGGRSAPVGSNQTIVLQFAGTDIPVPADATSVTLNVTAVAATAATYITVYADGQARPTASNLNVRAGETISNLVTVPIVDDALDFYNHSGSVDLVADVVGYHGGPGVGVRLHPLTPTRLLDTRDGTGGHLGQVGPGGVLALKVTGEASAVVLEVTAVNPTRAGNVTVYQSDSTVPVASNLNFAAGQTISNLVVVSVGTDGVVDFHNANGNVDLVADVFATYSKGASATAFGSLGPVRVLDTRDGTGGGTGRVGPDQAISVQVAGTDGVPAAASAVVVNLTAVAPTTASYVTAYPDGSGRPAVSTLNVAAGQTVPSLAIIPVGPDGRIALYNHSGSVDLVADLAGYYVGSADPRWTAASASLPPTVPADSTVLFAGAACAGLAGCVLNGEAAGPDGTFPLLTTGSGTSWTPFSPALPADSLSPPSASVDRITCAPTQGAVPNCLAIETYEDSNKVAQRRVLTGFGTDWTTSALPDPPGHTGTFPVYVTACPAVDECVLVGGYADSAGQRQLAVFTGSGTAWSVATAPLPPGAQDAESLVLNEMACAAIGSCAAAGAFSDTAGTYHSFLLSGDAGSWTVVGTPMPDGASPGANSGIGVRDITCATATTCVAVGDYRDTSTAFHEVMLTGFGADWIAVEAPLPADVDTTNPAPRLGTVSCSSATSCTTLGSYNSTTKVGARFFVTGLGTSWATGPVPSRGATDFTCAGSDCLTEGKYTDSWNDLQIAVTTGTGPFTSIQAPLPPDVYMIEQDVNYTRHVLACGAPDLCVISERYIDYDNQLETLLLTGPAIL